MNSSCSLMHMAKDTHVQKILFGLVSPREVKGFVYKIPVVVIKVQIKGVKVLEGGQGVDVQLKAHVLEHKVQPHLLQLVILVG